jgi:hypothetical protein
MAVAVKEVLPARCPERCRLIALAPDYSLIRMETLLR